MGWVDREHIPTLEQDWRYGRLINLTRRLLEERVPACGNCQGRGEVGNPVDNEDNGQAGGGR